MARNMVDHFDVYLLSRHFQISEEPSLLRKAFSRLLGMLRPRRVEQRDGVTVITAPLIYIRRARFEFLRSINTA